MTAYDEWFDNWMSGCFKDWFVRRLDGLSQTWTIGRSVAMLLGRDGGCSDCWMKGGIISWFFECRDG